MIDYLKKENVASMASKHIPIKLYKYNLSFSYTYHCFYNMHYQNCIKVTQKQINCKHAAFIFFDVL